MRDSSCIFQIKNWDMCSNMCQNIFRNVKCKYLKLELSLNVLTTELSFHFWEPCTHKVSWIVVSGGSWTWWPQVRSAFSRVGCDTHSVSKARTFLVNIQISNFSLKILKSGNIDFIDQRGTERLRPFYRVLFTLLTTLHRVTLSLLFPLNLIYLPPQAFGFALADSVTQHAGGQASHLLTLRELLDSCQVTSCLRGLVLSKMLVKMWPCLPEVLGAPMLMICPSFASLITEDPQRGNHQQMIWVIPWWYKMRDTNICVVCSMAVRHIWSLLCNHDNRF